ncbi:MAG: phospho-N-acetylmuramoyl-pentapeptide-transferase [Verrucomicrobiales bacterium]|nr:phospho-N-acetylmuramoyl-pentapeptide-transferase [Verrucomicrobiales bacterium]
MLYYLSQYVLEHAGATTWGDFLSGLRVLQYITFRSAGAAVTALLLSLWLGPRVIRGLLAMDFGQQYVDRARAVAGSKVAAGRKLGVPTMGGLLIVVVIDLTALLWAQWNTLVVLTLVPLIGLAALGFYDDYAKITAQKGDGVRGRIKLLVQGAIGLFLGVYLWRWEETRTLVSDIMVPFFKNPVLTGVPLLGAGLTLLTVMGSSNAVNLTDGMDGLAIGCTLIVTLVLVVLTYVASHVEIARYLNVPHVNGAGELTVVCAGMFGAGLGFLWFNCHPAQVFMGDTGSLALGGVLGIIAVLIHQPLVLLIAGGVFVMEALSVMLQVGYFKYSRRRTGEGRRVFRRAPLHHHFEELGWAESQVVTRFYILGIFFGVLALATLKLR